MQIPSIEEHAQDGARREPVPNPLGGARRALCASFDSEEHAQNGARREPGPNPLGGARRTLCASALMFTLALTPVSAEKDKTPVTDDTIVDQVRVRIADDSEVGGQPIQVDAHNGVVVLTGKITNDKLKSRVEKLAKKVKGVTGVDDKLVVSTF